MLQTSQNTQIFHRTVGLVNFKFLPDQTKFCQKRTYDNTKQQEVINSSFQDSFIPVIVFSIFLYITHIKYQTEINFNDVQPRIKLANHRMKSILEAGK